MQHISRAEFKRALIEAAIIMVIGLIGGLLFVYALPETSDATFNMLRDTLAPLGDLQSIELFGLILVNNVLKAYLAMAVGLGLGIYSVFFLIVNGFVLGTVMEILGNDVGLGFVFASIVPHGIFEIPAVLSAAALGLILGRCGFRRLRGKGCDIRPLWKESHKIFITYILPTLVVAAFIEVFVTPFLAGLA